jgi:HEAT repeat protein
LRESLASREVADRRYAAIELKKMGPPAAEAVPELIAVLDDPEERVGQEAVEALGQIGKAAVPALIDALVKATAWRVRRGAAAALSRIGPAAAGAVPTLINAVRGPKMEIRRAAAEALGKIGPPAAEAAIPALVETLGGRATMAVLAAAAEALGAMGPAATTAVPRLTILLKDDRWQVGSAAAEALGKIGPTAADAVSELIAVALDSAKWRPAVAAAIVAIGKIGPVKPEVIPTLVRALKNHEGEAAQALGMIGPAAAEAIPALTALTERNSFWSGDARDALRQIQQKNVFGDL